MKYDYQGAAQLDIMYVRDEDIWYWGWIAGEEGIKSGRFWISHGSGNPLADGDEFVISKDTRLLLIGKYAFKDSENLDCISTKREVKDFPHIKITRL